MNIEYNFLLKVPFNMGISLIYGGSRLLAFLQACPIFIGLSAVFILKLYLF